MSRRLLTSTQVAEILSEPEATTRRRTRQGIYDDFALNLGTDQRPRWRYDQARLERWLDQHLPSSRTLPARGRGAGLPGGTPMKHVIAAVLNGSVDGASITGDALDDTLRALISGRRLVRSWEPPRLLGVTWPTLGPSGWRGSSVGHAAYFGPWRVVELLEYREEEDGRVAVVRLSNGSVTDALAAGLLVLPGGAAYARRAWAKEQGIPCPARGRYLPADVVQAIGRTA